MIGANPGQVPTQGERLADLFEAAGYPVTVVSRKSNRYLRLLDIIHTLLQHRHDVDIQCLQVFGGPSFIVEDIASWIGHRFGARIVMCLRGGALPQFISRYPRWSDRVLKRADFIVVPSEYLHRTMAQLGLKSQIIPNVLEFSDYPYRLRAIISPRLIWMRAFHEIYNPEMAVRVLRLLRESFPSAVLTMAGPDKGLLKKTQKLAQELGVAHAVRFAGTLDMKGKIAEGERNDIYLTTNRIDNMPVSVLEMAAMGLPIISTAVGGIADLLSDQVTGLLVPDDDACVMAEAVKQLLTDARLTKRLSSNGRELVRGFTWEQLQPLWEHALGRAAII